MCFAKKGKVGFVLFVLGWGMLMLFDVGGMVVDKKWSLRSKLAVFCLGVVLVIAGILLILWGF